MYFRWCRRGGGVPVPGFLKQRRIVRLARTYHCSTFVETGTFHGEMVEGVYAHFQRSLSVEWLESLYRENEERFRGISTITLFHGRSEDRLPDMLSLIQGRVVFWLDAHYSGAGTAGGEEASCPILRELEAIRQARAGREDCIVVDDVRCFDGTKGYPTSEQVKQALWKINPSCQIFLEHDAFIAVSPKAAGGTDVSTVTASRDMPSWRKKVSRAMDTPLLNVAKSLYRKVKFFLKCFWLCRRVGDVPDSDEVKRKRLLSLARRYDCSTFVETGTYHGGTLNCMCEHFEKALSVEWFEPLFRENQARFSEKSNVLLFHGNSDDMLNEMIPHIQGRAMFWLDAHYCGGGTAGETHRCPLLGELDAIRRARRGEDCIVMDDARYFTGRGGYPSRDVLTKTLRTINPSYDIYLEGDALIAVPT